MDRRTASLEHPQVQVQVQVQYERSWTRPGWSASSLLPTVFIFPSVHYPLGVSSSAVQSNPVQSSPIQSNPVQSSPVNAVHIRLHPGSSYASATLAHEPSGSQALLTAQRLGSQLRASSAVWRPLGAHHQSAGRLTPPSAQSSAVCAERAQGSARGSAVTPVAHEGKRG